MGTQFEIEDVKEIIHNNGGFVQTKQLEDLGISRMKISELKKSNALKQVIRGVYTIPKEEIDEFSLFQARCPSAIYSYATALYFWNLSDRVPYYIDITVPQGTNTSRFKKENPQYRFHYSIPKFYDVGTTIIDSPMGGKVKLYDEERCICDLIKSRNNIDKQIYTHAIKEYFSGQINYRKLIPLANKLKVEDMVRVYLEVLQ